MTVLRPQITTERKILTSLVGLPGQRIAAMIGTAIWGPINTLTTVENIADYTSNFADDKAGTGVTGIKGADLFLRNGGTLKFLRIADSNVAKADYMGQNGGSTDVINFEGKYKGTHGNNIFITSTANGSARDIKVTDGSTVELFTNAGSGYATNDAIAAAINATSVLITATVEAGQGTINLLETFASTQLTGGDDGEDSLVDADFINAFDNYLESELYNFLLIPGKTVDSFHSSIVAKIDNRETTEKLYSRYITGIAVDETIATATARTSASKRLTVVAPSIKYTNRVDAIESNLDGSYLACAYAGKLASIDVEISGTHETISVDELIVSTSTSQKYYSKTEQEQLLQGRIAPVSLISNTVQMIRGVTRIADTTSVNFEEVIVDITDNVTESVETFLNTVIGKPNSSTSRSAYAAEIDAILQNLRSIGVLEAYQSTTVSQGASNDTLIVSVSIQPVFSTNFITLTINVN